MVSIVRIDNSQSSEPWEIRLPSWDILTTRLKVSDALTKTLEVRCGSRH